MLGVEHAVALIAAALPLVSATAQGTAAAVPARPATMLAMTMDYPYPPTAMVRHEEGRVIVAFEVTARGSVRDCRVVQSSGSPTLDRSSCDLMMRRATFAPAQDASGKAVPSTKQQVFDWRLPR